jgi:nitrogen fixation protein NifB
VKNVKAEASKYLPQMHHCTRCRADAVGLLGEKPNRELMKLLQQYKAVKKEEPAILPENSKRPYIAVASMEGMLVNQHLGEAAKLFIYGREDGDVILVDTRETPPSGGGLQRWSELARVLYDCQALLVSGIGKNPQQLLVKSGVKVMVVEGLIEEAINAVFDGRNMNHLLKREKTACGAACSGTGGGCG